MKETPIKIVGVNVSTSYPRREAEYMDYFKRVVKPLEGPWGFSYVKTKYYPPKYLVAIDHSVSDSIGGCYNVIQVYNARKYGVTFELAKCSPEEEALVRKLIEGKNLEGFSITVLVG